MASRYRDGSPESQYGRGRKGYPKGHEPGISWKDENYDKDRKPFGSNERVPSSGPVEGVDYFKAIEDLVIETDNYSIAYAQGDDKYLEAAFRRVDLTMDQVFRGPETAKKPDVLRSNAGGRPISPDEALQYMYYFTFRAELEWEQANPPEAKFQLPGVDAWRLDEYVKQTRSVFKQCAEYDLFSKEQGWRYDKSYDELWRGEWRDTDNAMSNWLNAIINPQEMDLEPPSPMASSPAPPTPMGSDSTRPATPETPTVATSPAIPAAATPVGSSVVPTAGVPSTPSAANTMDSPEAPKKRKPLPFSGDQQPDQKRSRPSPSPSPSLSPKTQPSRLPPTGTFTRLCLAGSNGESSGTSQPAAGGDVAVASASSSTTTSKQSKGKANGSELKSKTVNEQAKADRLLDDGVGQEATSPCNNCQKVAGRRCLVARDPVAYKSLKCEHCIRNKLGGCFCADNPGIQYDQQVIDTMRKIEQSRKKT